MSLYKKSWLFSIWTLAVLCTFPYWVPLLEKLLGPFGLIAGAAIGLSHGLLSLSCFHCPECDLSPFRSGSGFFSAFSPWPRKKCGHCGHDHTLAD
ncbi:MAG: hypothetical protein ACREIP_08090 [Alphaproteobacteria bacterium]